MTSRESVAFTNSKEYALVLFFCFAAALRVFIFSAGFPFFSNIDEDLHFDLITQYSHARLPRTFDLLKEETLTWIVPYASPEFLQTPDQFPGAKFPQPFETIRSRSRARDCGDKSCLGHRNQFRIFSATAVLRAGQCLVADRATHRINGNPGIVLDSFPERSADRDRGLARLCNRADDCT